jgi:four helix bundle protein
VRDHTKLRAFELADEVAMLVYRGTAGFPKEELFGLTSQIRRAAVSVPSNIVEGCARDSEAEYLGFLNIAFGSLRELHYQLNLSKRLGFLRNEDSSLLEPKVVETEKVLNGLIRALRDNVSPSA